MSPAIKGTEPKAWLQEIKANRRLQVGLVCIPVLAYLLWPSSTPARPGQGAGRARGGSLVLDERQARELAKLPDLSTLGQAGQLPTEARMYRDLFTFEGPPPPPPPPAPPPPPPPTPEQIAAEQLRQGRAAENATRPQDLRYLGYLGSATAGRLGAFMRGEDPVTIKQGDLANPHWRLVKLSDLAAEFQNLKYSDIRTKLDAVDASGTGGRVGQAPVNEF